jgi:hypothetical protein
MLVVDAVRVRPLTVTSAEVTWTLKPTDEPLIYSRFRVLRSESPEGIYVDISGPLANTFTFLDKVNLKSKFSEIGWRIQVDDLQTGISTIYPNGTFDESFEFHPNFDRVAMTEDYGPTFIALEVVRRNNLYLRRFTGRVVAYCPVREQGQRCPLCFDNTKRRSNNSSCRECFGTTFHGGYYEPINVFVDVNPSPNVVQISTFGKMEINQTAMFMSNFPLAKPGDLIVERSNRRWRVVQVNVVTEKRYTVQQYIQAEEIEKSDAEFLFPVDLDLKSPPEDFVGFFPKRYSPRAIQVEGSGLL